MNSKNKLQEFCQKSKWELPKYQSSCTDGMWSSVVMVGDIKVKSRKSYPSKVKAEINAAKYALRSITMKTTDVTTISKDTLYVVDLENVKFNHSGFVLGFVGANHHSVGYYLDNGWYLAKTYDLPTRPDRILYRITGGYKNLVDHYITMHVPLVYATCINFDIRKVCIVTGDNAGWCTKTCLEEYCNAKGNPGILNISVTRNLT